MVYGYRWEMYRSMYDHLTPDLSTSKTVSKSETSQICDSRSYWDFMDGSESTVLACAEHRGNRPQFLVTTRWGDKDCNVEERAQQLGGLQGKDSLPIVGFNMHDVERESDVFPGDYAKVMYRDAAVVIKHQTPCGLAEGNTLKEAFERAWFGDEISAYGSVVGFSRPVDELSIKALSGKYVEAVIASEFSEGAIKWIQGLKSKKDLRVIATGVLSDAPEFTEVKHIRGGVLTKTQSSKLYLCDNVGDLVKPAVSIVEPNSENVYQVGLVTQHEFAVDRTSLIEFGIKAGKHTKSNAIVIAYQDGQKGEYRVLGAGTGQPNRVDSVWKLAQAKAKENLMRQMFREQGRDYAMEMDRMMQDSGYNTKMVAQVNGYVRDILGSNKVILYSDAFFPKQDTLHAVADAGIKTVITPGGSKYDDDVINAANAREINMIFTGIRKFKH